MLGYICKGCGTLIFLAFSTLYIVCWLLCLLILQPMSIVMIVVGPKFVSINDHKVPVAWTIVALTLLGAVISGKLNAE